jgi:hypothetical protein
MRCVVVDALACIEQDVLPLHQVDRTLQLVCWNPSYCIHNTLPLFMQQQRSFSQGYCQILLLFSFSLLYFPNYARTLAVVETSKTTPACIISQKLFSLHVAVKSRLQGMGCSTVHTHFVGTVIGRGRVCMVGGVESIWLSLPSKPALQIAGFISRPKGLPTAS